MPRALSILILPLLLLGLAAPRPVFAGVQEFDAWVEYSFGDQIFFYAQIQSDAPVEQAIIFFQAANDTRTTVGLADVTQLDENHYKLSYTHDLSEYTIRTFSQVTYRYKVNLAGGEVYQSPTYQFYFEDNRYDWQTLEESPFRVHWFEGDLTFAQNLLDVAQEGLLQIQGLLPLPTPEVLEIYVYPTASAMQDTLRPSSENWVAGHADPDLGVMVVALPDIPEQRLLMEQRIPHELMHIMLYQYTGLGYANLPTWLNEGLASMAELYPNPDYRIMLESAVEKETLLPIASLCWTFPRDASSALLSYAQSSSFTYYLYNTFGASGLNKLVNAYTNGLDCERGVQTALGINLTQLERGWRSEMLAQDVNRIALNNLLPWLALLLAALATPLILALSMLRRKPTRSAKSQLSSQ